MPTCPDCDVEMEETNHMTNHGGEELRIDTGRSLLGALGAKGGYLCTYVCPDCDLVRFYRDR